MSRKAPQKPKQLKSGSNVAIVAPASPGSESRVEAGILELQRLGFRVAERAKLVSEGYFAGPTAARLHELRKAMTAADIDAVLCTRGGYGANYLLDALIDEQWSAPKLFIGFSDITYLQVYLWQTLGWVTIYGPMVGAGLDRGVGKDKGYDLASFTNATSARARWEIDLQGSVLVSGKAEGIVLGGALTILESTLGTPWELDATDSILLLEDRGMKPYQVDRSLKHLLQAGKFERVKGIVFGDFPECEPPVANSPSVMDVCNRLLGPLGVPVVFGSPFGHTARPMLSIPLGIRAALTAEGSGKLTFLESAVTE